MNTKIILSQNLKLFENILENVIKKLIENEEPVDLTYVEEVIKETISNTIKLILNFVTLIVNSKNYDKDLNCPKCGRKMRTIKKDSSINLMTMFGTIVFKRNYLYCRCCHIGHGKGDQTLKIDNKHKLSKGMVDLITYIGQLVPFSEGVKLIDKFLGYMEVKTCESTIQDVSERIGKKAYEKTLSEADILNDTYYKFEKKKDLKHDLYIMMDGSHVNTREKNDTGTTWKEMKLGEVFSSRDIIHRKNEDSIITKKDYCTHLGSVDVFKKILLKSVFESGYLEHEKVVVIADGAKWIWNLCDEFFPESVKILDFYHLVENIHRYAKVIFPNNDIERKIWANTVINYVKNGKEDLAIKVVKETKIDGEDLPAGVVNLPEYLENNRDRIRYKKFEDEGFYIGSGPIESGNKTVIQQRLKQAGMRWSVDGAQFIAALRAKYKSNKWNEVLEVI